MVTGLCSQCQLVMGFVCGFHGAESDVRVMPQICTKPLPQGREAMQEHNKQSFGSQVGISHRNAPGCVGAMQGCSMSAAGRTVPLQPCGMRAQAGAALGWVEARRWVNGCMIHVHGTALQHYLGPKRNLLSLGLQGPCADLREGSALQPNSAQQRGFGFSPRASRIKISAANVGCMALPRQHHSSGHLPSTAMGSSGRTELHGHSWHMGMAPTWAQHLIWG